MKAVLGLRPVVRHDRRRPARFRVQVEGLEARRPLAAGVFGSPLALPEQIPGQPIATVDPAHPELAPTPGRSVPLVNLGSITGTLSASGFTATVDWGDGSPLDTATIVPSNVGQLQVEGPDHTYAAAADYTVTVAVVEPGDAVATPFQTVVHVVDPAYLLTGRLDPASARGRSDNTVIATTATPTFTGTARPGEPVTISANLFGSSAATTTSTVADASGHWSLTSAVLGLGSYTVVASVPGTSISVPVPTSFLVVDTTAAAATSGTRIGTTVSGFRVIDARQGTFEISFHDASATGLSPAPLAVASNYSATLAAGPRSKRSLGVSNLGSNIVYYTHVEIPSIYSDYTIDGRIGDGTHLLPKTATITLTVHSSGITNAAGVALDGEFVGKYPTGDGTPGGDYQVRIGIRNGRVVSLVPVRSARAAARHRA